MQAGAPKRTSERSSPAGAHTPIRTSDTLTVGRLVDGRFRLEAALDRRARVWRAVDDTGRRHALKTGLKRLIEHEYRTLSALDHAHIVRASDRIESDAGTFLVLEYLAGGDLVSLAGLAPGTWLGALGEVVDALRFLHARGVVHRDLKARNVMLDASGHARLIDFGSAEAAGSSWRAGGTTRAAVAPGRGDGPVCAADDVYALACLVHEMLHGCPPGAREPKPVAGACRGLARIVAEALGAWETGASLDLERFRTVIESLTENPRIHA